MLQPWSPAEVQHPDPRSDAGTGEAFTSRYGPRALAQGQIISGLGAAERARKEQRGCGAGRMGGDPGWNRGRVLGKGQKGVGQ